jgi:hypothetical protein
MSEDRAKHAADGRSKRRFIINCCLVLSVNAALLG